MEKVWNIKDWFKILLLLVTIETRIIENNTRCELIFSWPTWTWENYHMVVNGEKYRTKVIQFQNLRNSFYKESPHEHDIWHILFSRGRLRKIETSFSKRNSMTWPKEEKIQGPFSGSGNDQFGYSSRTKAGNETI